MYLWYEKRYGDDGVGSKKSAAKSCIEIPRSKPISDHMFPAEVQQAFRKGRYEVADQFYRYYVCSLINTYEHLRKVWTQKKKK